MALVRRQRKSSRVVKTEEPTVDQELHDRLLRLRAVAEHPTVTLSDELSADLEVVKLYARQNYGTPAYAAVYRRITELFAPEALTPRDGEERPPVINYNPQTVGAFFVGCVVSVGDSPELNEGCTLQCAGSLPPPPRFLGDGPEIKHWGFCSHNVLWAINKNSPPFAKALTQHGSRFVGRSLMTNGPDNFTFIPVSTVLTSRRAVIFVSYPSYDAFPGFTRREKAQLIYRNGIDEVMLLAFKEGDTRVERLYPDPVKTYRIKQRADKRDESDAKEARAAAIATLADGPISADTVPTRSFLSRLFGPSVAAMSVPGAKATGTTSQSPLASAFNMLAGNEPPSLSHMVVLVGALILLAFLIYMAVRSARAMNMGTTSNQPKRRQTKR